MLRGYPYNRAMLNDPQILATATDKVQKERANVLCSRGIDMKSTLPVPPNQHNLLTTGSDHYAGADLEMGLTQIRLT